MTFPNRRKEAHFLLIKLHLKELEEKKIPKK
jgi:hypothetical protein